MDLKKYMDAFASEAEELIQTMNKTLIELEKDPVNKDNIYSLFRCAHSLKGMSATMGFAKTAELAHSMESLMDGFRNGNSVPDAEIFSLLFEGADSLEKSIKNIVTAGAEDDPSALTSKIAAAAAKRAPETKPPAQASAEPAKAQEPEKKEEAPPEKKAGSHTFAVNVTLKAGSQMKALKFEVVRARLSKIGRVIKEEIRSENQTEYVLATDEGMKRAEDEAEAVSEVEKAEVSIYSGQPEVKKKSSPEEQKTEHAEQVSHIKVPVGRLDNLVNLAGELITTKIRIARLVPEGSSALRDAASALERIAVEIQNEAMLARMVPAEQIFAKFPRMVRDIAKEEGKEINFSIEGGNIELDRSVLERISEPVTHLIRNAADHGIEAPEDRMKAGKQRAGTIKLSARRDKNNIVVQVSDDGRGLDIEEIRRTAIEKNIADRNEVEEMDDKDVPWLMFRGGFSTSKKVTEVSGRGVGLNIVKTTVETMGGTIELEGDAGKGCTFTMHLPLSLAIMHALLVESGAEEYAIPLSCVQYIHKMQQKETTTIQKRRTIILDGEAVPVVSLNELFRQPDNSKEDPMLLVIKKGRERAGIAVDRIIGEQELMIKPLEQPTGGISGASIMPDGKVVLVPDIYGLI